MNASHDDLPIDERLALVRQCHEQGDPWQVVVHCRAVREFNL